MLSDIERYVALNSVPRAKRLGIEPEVVEHLIRIYGSRYSEVLDCASSDRRLLDPINAQYQDIMAQVVYGVEIEGARTLTDVLLRRLTLGMSATRGRDAAGAVAALLAQRLNWDTERVRCELSALDEQLALGAPPDLADMPSRVAVASG
jgi:glycerol-3-phosphate dehydrogenase